jgi:hypothetical protein
MRGARVQASGERRQTPSIAGATLVGSWWTVSGIAKEFVNGAALFVRRWGLSHLAMPARIAKFDAPSIQEPDQHDREADDGDASVSMLAGFICEIANHAKASSVKRDQSDSMRD